MFYISGGKYLNVSINSMKIGKRDLGYKINIDTGNEELKLPDVGEYTLEETYIVFRALMKLTAVFAEFLDAFFCLDVFFKEENK